MTNAFASITLQHPGGAVVQVMPHGAHVLSWRSAEGTERLYLSPRAEFKAGTAVRGGVPVIFPQFAALGPLPKHGFARVTAWEQVGASDTTASTGTTAEFVLRHSPETHAIWPYRFTARYQVELGDDYLRLRLTVLNEDVTACTFTAALHTYLRVTDIAAVSVHGLQGCRYRDSAHGNVEAVESAAALRFAGEVDRIYFSTTQPIMVNEPGEGTLRCTSEGFADTVVWNPGAALAQKLPDMDDDGYRHMVCVEAAAIATPVTLASGEQWSGVQMLTVL